MAEKRLLVIAPVAVHGDALREEILRRAGNEAAEVHLVAPAVTESKVKAALGDVDDAIDDADRRLERSVERLHDRRISASGQVGDADPLVALEDALKGVGMFQTVGVPILGLIENMSYFLCPCCSTRTDIFAHGGTRKASEQQQLPFLGEIPLDTKIRLGGDQGIPIVVAEPNSVYSTIFADMCQKLITNIRTIDASQRARAVIIQ